MWMATTSMALPALPVRSARDIVVAVPARNEAASIAACLAAIDTAAHGVVTPRPVEIVVLVNGSDDATARVAHGQRLAAARLSVIETTLPEGLRHAGGARGAAMAAGMRRLAQGGIIMTTDADSRVAPGWIAANLAEIAAGADAVAGVVTFDAAARAALPRLPEARDLEWRLADLQARLGTLIDPRPHDPWPNHIWAWGASLAVTRAAYVAVGGLPAVPLAEDRALAAAIERHDLRLRHSHAPVVFTSPRRVGRAPGGFADLIDRYVTDPAMVCDAAIEPVVGLMRRLRWRARLRRCHATDGPTAAAALARARLGVASAPAPGFGAFWAGVEAQAAGLARRRVAPAALPGEVARAEWLVSRLTGLGGDRGDSRASALAA